MKINFSAVLLDMAGEPIPQDDRPNAKPATLGSVSCTALLAQFPDEQNLAAEIKVKRFRLAEAATKGGEQDLPVDDVAELKRLLAKAFGPLIVGRAFDIIEPPVANV